MTAARQRPPRRTNRSTTVLDLIERLLDAVLAGEAGWKQALVLVFLAWSLATIAVTAFVVLRSGLSL